MEGKRGKQANNPTRNPRTRFGKIFSTRNLDFRQSVQTAAQSFNSAGTI
jgi:hypothetical protein